MSKNTGLKMLLLIGLAIIVVGMSVALILIAYQYQVRKSEFAKMVMDHPDNAAVVVYTFDEKGELVEDGYDLYLNADAPLVAASMMKVMVLTAYESAVVSGDLNPDELISIADLEAYYLPKTDGNAHINGLASLGLKTDELGFAHDQQASIRLDEIAKIMIHYSGNAETDYLIHRLGYEKVNSIQGMSHHTPIHSLLGASLAMMNHENSLANDDLRQTLIKDVENMNYEYFDHLVDLYLNDSEWRARQIDYMRSDQYINAANELGWQGQVEAGQLFPKGTAREYAQLMASIANGRLISLEVSTQIQSKLESIPTDWPLRAFFFHRYGSKDGLTAGLINLASYGIPKNGPLSGNSRVSVVMTNNLPVQFWVDHVKGESIYFVQGDLMRAKGIWDLFQ
ncbi:MAG: hypothetical protein CVU42_04605 [Chloroflexi bacterium HGW-Chloroflexi-4]|jgi:hypothetical protein|nr:MAG: hypothetical protein CVU42_04605 [Chloroflexi bacterium HGW-Chloroflexi-4]